MAGILISLGGRLVPLVAGMSVKTILPYVSRSALGAIGAYEGVDIYRKTHPKKKTKKKRGKHGK